jgi:hypothetical protein
MACGLILALGISLWGSRGRRWKLADGSELTLLSVTVGTNLVEYTGNRFQRWAARLSAPIGAQFGGKVIRYPNGGETNVAFAFHYRGKREVNNQSFLFKVRDDDGVEASPRFDIRTRPTAAAEASLFCVSRRLPPASKEIVLLVFDNAPRRPVLLGQLRMPNPLLLPKPAWTPSVLPANGREKDLTVRLLDAQIGMGPDLDFGWRDVNGRVPADAVARFRFALVEDGQPSDEWTLAEARCRDSLQSRKWPWRATVEGVGPGLIDLTGEWPLWPGRQAISLETAWVRKSAPPSGRMLALRDIPLSQWKTNLAGGFTLLVQPLDFGPRSLHVFMGDRRPAAEIAADPMEVYFLSARDVAGQPFQRIDATTFHVPFNVTNADLVVYVNPVRRVEFLFTPSLATTNATDSLSNPAKVIR